MQLHKFSVCLMFCRTEKFDQRLKDIFFHYCISICNIKVRWENIFPNKLISLCTKNAYQMCFFPRQVCFFFVFFIQHVHVSFFLLQIEVTVKIVEAYLTTSALYNSCVIYKRMGLIAHQASVIQERGTIYMEHFTQLYTLIQYTLILKSNKEIIKFSFPRKFYTHIKVEV